MRVGFGCPPPHLTARIPSNCLRRILVLKWHYSLTDQAPHRAKIEITNYRLATLYFGGMSSMHGKRITNISSPTTDQRHIPIMSPSRVYFISTMNLSISIPISLGLQSFYLSPSLPMPLLPTQFPAQISWHLAVSFWASSSVSLWAQHLILYQIILHWWIGWETNSTMPALWL